MRGKGCADSFACGGGGITPACAGKSLKGGRHGKHDQDHPRVCGEKRRSYISRCVSVGSPPRVRGKAPPPQRGSTLRGSPPRVRGKDSADGDGAHPGGITPACAGKSEISLEPVPADGDHPRVCGEKFPHLAFRPVNGGSPPRVRGKEK